MTDPRCTVIGLGSPLMGDDGVGLVALERLRREFDLPPQVELIDGGTWGMSLLPVIEDAERLLFLDAINTGAAPGTVITLRRDEIPRYLAMKVSPHQVDLADVLAVAELRGTLPKETIAVGLQPERVEMSVGLSPTLEHGLDGLLATAVRQLEAWGASCRPRPEAICA
ncbi:MAG TPA: HyaD/HybD family hydrogenase maturation endopeptidase [Gemmatimonadaceae bacterium]|nr:HyaD/HybD family hydrogenase maturation endopeptidase [Gemmatimonadaceae bacterium]